MTEAKEEKSRIRWKDYQQDWQANPYSLGIIGDNIICAQVIESRKQKYWSVQIGHLSFSEAPYNSLDEAKKVAEENFKEFSEVIISDALQSVREAIEEQIYELEQLCNSKAPNKYHWEVALMEVKKILSLLTTPKPMSKEE